METQFHEQEHESKMRLLKPTHTPLNGEATKPIKNTKKKGKRRDLSVRDRKNVKENHHHIT